LNKLAKVADYIRDLWMTRTILSFKNNGYLVEIGWYDTYRKKKPVDINKDPIPWVTYSYIDFIKPFLTKNKTVFEYGSGYSSMFYASKVHKLITIEHDEAWYQKLKPELAENVDITFVGLTEAYPKAILEHDELFDIIVIDGRKRIECIRYAVKKIKAEGVIVLDDSERDKYKEGIQYLKDQGFMKIDFWGISPAYFHNKCTTVFSKDFNAFLSQQL
jgi:precorrin-6B methylase 2